MDFTRLFHFFFFLKFISCLLINSLLLQNYYDFNFFIYLYNFNYLCNFFFFLFIANTFNKCKRNDPNLGKCLIDAVNNALPQMKEGNFNIKYSKTPLNAVSI